jgi:hypothetical protein
MSNSISMIVNNDGPIKKNDVLIVRLLNGQDLITEVVSVDKEGIRIKNPVRMVMMPPGANGNPTIGFAPWAEFSSDKVFVLRPDHVLAMMTPIAEFTNQYQSMFNKIITPNKQLIIPPGV